MAVEIQTSFIQITDDAGDPVSGARIYVYDVGTTTPRNVYAASDLSGSPAANPIVCDAYGRHDIRYTATGSYKIVVKTSADVTIYTRDNIDGRVPVGSGALPIANGGTGSTSAGAAIAALGGATSAELADVAADVASLAGSLSSNEKTHIATGTTAQRPGTPVQGDLRMNTSLGGFGLPELYDGTNWRFPSLAQPIAGGFKNLIITNNAGTPNSQVDIDADAVTVETTSGEAYRLLSVNLTVDCTTVGANGLDASSLGNSTWYSIWVIYNPTTATTAGLVGTSATAPTMPSGYTAKARLGWMRTNSSAQFLRSRQMGRIAQWVVGTNPAVARNIANGVAGTYSVTSPTLASQSIAAFAPSTASALWIMGTTSYGGGTNGSVLAAPNTSWGGTNNGPAGSASQVWPLSLNSTNIGGRHNQQAWILLESTAIGWSGDATGSGISAQGWEDNI